MTDRHLDETDSSPAREAFRRGQHGHPAFPEEIARHQATGADPSG
jgi:hypothetical protein